MSRRILLLFLPYESRASWGLIWFWLLWSVVWLGYLDKQIVHRFKAMFRELVSWLWGCGSWLQVVEAAVKLVLK